MGDPFRLTHLGGPTTLLEVGGLRVLTDPTFDPPGGRYRFTVGASSRKTAGPARPAPEVEPVDLVLVTHVHHADNLDTIGRAVAARAPAVCTTRSGAAKLGGMATGLAPWDTVVLRPPGKRSVRVTATPCRHGPPLSRRLVGDVVGFVVEVEGGEPVAWFSGDTVLYDGVREVAGSVAVDVAVLHVGAVRFGLTGPLRYTMGIDDAVELAELVQPRVAVPVHFDGWSHFSEGEAAVRARLTASDGSILHPFRILDRGVPSDLSP